MSDAPPKKLEWVVYDEPSYGTSSREMARAILEGAGYVENASGSAGTYRLTWTDVAGRTGTQTYDLDVFEDPTRPVIDRIRNMRLAPRRG